MRQFLSGRDVPVLILIQFLYGTSYIVSKELLHSFPPIIWALLRSSVGALALLLVMMILKRPHPPKTIKFFSSLFIFALFGGMITPIAFLLGLSYTSSTNSAILNTLIPVFALVIGACRRQETLTPFKVLGFILALLGVFVLCRGEELRFSSRTSLGDFLTLINCVSYSVFLVYSKSFFEKHDQLWCTTWFFILSSLGIGVFSVPYWDNFHWPIFTPELIFSMSYGILGATVLAYFLTIWALSKTEASKVAIFGYLQPMVTTFFAWMLFNEKITMRSLFASTLIFVGVFLAICYQRARVVISEQNSLS